MAILAVATGACGQGFTFQDVSSERGLSSYATPTGLCAGIAAADFDADGYVDLFVPQACGIPDALYRNLGDGSFEEIANLVGLASTEASRAALWFDYDRDGDLDLVVARDQFDGTCAGVLTLYQQDAAGLFADVTLESNLIIPQLPAGDHIGGLCAGDVVGDDAPDLCVAVWQGETMLFRNNPDGTFTDVSVSSGIAATHPKPWQTMIFDADGDGLHDIFIAVDVQQNHLWMNQGDGTFVDQAAAAGVDQAGNEMGVTIGDFDNDGLLDVYVTNINVPQINQTNTMLRNVSTPGSPLFEDVSAEWGVDIGGWGFIKKILDANRDGLLDLAATNGRFGDDSWEYDPSVFFLHGPDGFTEVAADVNFADTWVASCLVSVDADRDGDMDVVQACHHDLLRLLDNQPVAARGTQPGWITIKPRQPGANHFAIGAVVRATVGETTMTRLIHAGCSMLGQEPAEAHFGLGNATIIDTITIEWPDGAITTVDDVTVNQVLTINRPVEPCPGDATGDNTVDLADLLQVIGNWGSDGSAGGDVNNDSTVNLGDLLEVIGHWGSTC